MTSLDGRVFAGTLLIGASCLACSANGGDKPAGAGGFAAGGSGAAASGGSASGGSGGSGFELDGGAASGGGGGVEEDAACSEVEQQAMNRIQPADIVIIVDNSGSMTEEAGFVQKNMNTFSSGIAQAGIDYHVVLISAPSNESRGICAAAPLGSGSCPNDDNPPNFLHVDTSVGSTNSLDLLISQFPQYSAMLRPGAAKHVVVITDDNSSLPAQSFDTQYKALLAGVDPLFTDYVFHSIYGYTDPGPVCLLNPQADKCCGKGFPPGPLTASVGTVYRDLVMMKGGVSGNLCEQNFLPVFSAVSQKVVQNAQLACEWNIPTPPNGGTVDPNKVNVDYIAGGQTQSIGRVNSAAECASVGEGWFYDDPQNPTKIYVCPNTCQKLQGAADAEIKILFGCASKPAVPQ